MEHFDFDLLDFQLDAEKETPEQTSSSASFDYRLLASEAVDEADEDKEDPLDLDRIFDAFLQAGPAKERKASLPDISYSLESWLSPPEPLSDSEPAEEIHIQEDFSIKVPVEETAEDTAPQVEIQLQADFTGIDLALEALLVEPDAAEEIVLQEDFVFTDIIETAAVDVPEPLEEIPEIFAPVEVAEEAAVEEPEPEEIPEVFATVEIVEEAAVDVPEPEEIPEVSAPVEMPEEPAMEEPEEEPAEAPDLPIEEAMAPEAFSPAWWEALGEVLPEIAPETEPETLLAPFAEAEELPGTIETLALPELQEEDFSFTAELPDSLFADLDALLQEDPLADLEFKVIDSRKPQPSDAPMYTEIVIAPKAQAVPENMPDYQRQANQVHRKTTRMLGAGMYKVGVILEENQRYEKAMEYYLEAAAAGSGYAMSRIGYLYGQGLGVAQNTVEALKWILRASQHGDPVAQSILGIHPRNERE